MTPIASPQSLDERLRQFASLFLLFLVAASPWPFGSTTGGWRFTLIVGVVGILGVWSVHAAITRRFVYQPDLISSLLLGLVLLTAIQLIPLPAPVVRVISPQIASLHDSLVPLAAERLPGEAEAPPPSRKIRLTLGRAETEELLVAFTALYLVYAAARSFVLVGPSPAEQLRMLAWVGFGLGVALSLLGFAQALSGDRSLIYGRVNTQRDSFGPFVHKNHFAFQVNLLIGLSGGLFASVARVKGWRTPVGLGLLAGIGLMAAAILFSQSRGGVLAAVAASGFVAIVSGSRPSRHARERTRGVGWVLVGGVALVAGALIVWLGPAAVVDRLATLWDGKGDRRAEVWRSVMPLVEQYPLTGVGGGALPWGEQTIRTDPNLGVVLNTLDNEYLEAQVEGGIGRLLLTLGLAVGAIATAVIAYRRTGDPLLLGCAFGLVAVACQSVGDFGLHVPSVSLAAAVITAHAAACGARASKADAMTDPSAKMTGWAVVVAVGTLLVAGLILIAVELRHYRAAEYRETGQYLLLTSLDREAVIRYLEAGTRVRPTDSQLWKFLMIAHLAAATERQVAARAAVAGTVTIAVNDEVAIHGDPDGHLSGALRAARSVREQQPLQRVAHQIIGLYADRFTVCEPAGVHFHRAKLTAPSDPDLWYWSGRGAARDGDWDTALSDWRECLKHSTRRLRPIIATAAAHISPREIRFRLLPDDAGVWLAATPYIFPDRQSEGRKEWLRAVVARWSQGPEPTDLASYLAWNNSLMELGEHDEAEQLLRRVMERFPQEPEPRNRLASRLEADERYEDAVPILEWLAAHAPDRGDYRDRLAAARHALKLKAEINTP